MEQESASSHKNTSSRKCFHALHFITQHVHKANWPSRLIHPLMIRYIILWSTSIPTEGDTGRHTGHCPPRMLCQNHLAGFHCCSMVLVQICVQIFSRNFLTTTLSPPPPSPSPMPTPTKSTSALRPSSSTTSSRPTAKFQCWFLTPDLYRREKKHTRVQSIIKTVDSHDNAILDLAITVTETRFRFHHKWQISHTLPNHSFIMWRQHLWALISRWLSNVNKKLNTMGPIYTSVTNLSMWLISIYSPHDIKEM